MHVSLSRLRVLEHGASELIVAFRARVHLVEDADGFIDVQVWQSDHDAGEILMVSRWRDRGAFTAYMKSEAHASLYRRIDPSLQALIKLERREHLTPTRSWPSEPTTPRAQRRRTTRIGDTA